MRKHSISLDEILEIGVWFVVCGGKIDIVSFTIFITNSVQLSSSVFLQFSSEVQSNHCSILLLFVPIALN